MENTFKDWVTLNRFYHRYDFSSADLARHLKLTQRTIQRWIGQGKPNKNRYQPLIREYLNARDAFSLLEKIGKNP